MVLNSPVLDYEATFLLYFVMRRYIAMFSRACLDRYVVFEGNTLEVQRVSCLMRTS